MPTQLSRRAFLGSAAAGGLALAAGRVPTALASSPRPLRPDLAEDCRKHIQGLLALTGHGMV